MSYNRLKYDKCAYQKQLHESTSTFAYQLYGGKYKNCGSCNQGGCQTPETGTMSTACGDLKYTTYPLYSGKYIQRDVGNGVYKIIDIESELRGQYRLNTLCPNFKYLPNKYPRCQREQQYMPPELCPVIKTNLTEFKNRNFETQKYPLRNSNQTLICK